MNARPAALSRHWSRIRWKQINPLSANRYIDCLRRSRNAPTLLRQAYGVAGNGVKRRRLARSSAMSLFIIRVIRLIRG
jgi:hypothetical protein